MLAGSRSPRGTRWTRQTEVDVGNEVGIEDSRETEGNRIGTPTWNTPEYGKESGENLLEI